MRIDAHQHFWKFDPIRDSWITEGMQLLRRDFLPADLQPVLGKNNFNGCILVQSDQTDDGNRFMIRLAEKNSFIKAIVAWIDPQCDQLEEHLATWRQFPVIKGFRYILQSEENRSLMLEPAFLNGIKTLGKQGFTHDILIFSDQLRFIPRFLKNFPDQRFVLDHLGKPNIRGGEIADWKKQIKSLTAFDNLYCKISGMFTEADWGGWKAADFTPYLDTVVETFGTERLMFGSDWPVCLLAGSYPSQLEVIEDYFSGFSIEEQQSVFGENAVNFYNLER